MAREKTDTAQETRMADSWQLTYCSLIIILVSVFMMILSYSKVEGKRMEGFRGQYEKKGDARPTSSPGAKAAKPTNPEEGRIEAARESLMRILSGRTADGEASVTRIRSGVKVVFRDGVFFAPGALKIRDEARPLLDDLTSLIGETSLAVGIAGYGGSVSGADGGARPSWEMTVSRANLLLRHFAEQGGIPARRLSAAGFGSAPSSGSDGGRMELFFEIPS